MNAMLVYVMAAEGIFAAFINGWYYGDPHNTLVLMRVEQEQRVTEDAHRFVEQDAAAQRYAAQVLQKFV